MCFYFDQLAHVYSNGYHGQYPERGKQRFSPGTRQAQPEGHSVVLYEMKDSPITEKGDLLVERHMCFNQDLECLVCKKN